MPRLLFIWLLILHLVSIQNFKTYGPNMNRQLHSSKNWNCNQFKRSICRKKNIRLRYMSFFLPLICRLVVRKQPIILEASKLARKDFLPLIDKVRHRLSSWKRNSLSTGGWLVLVLSLHPSLSIACLFFFCQNGWLTKSIKFDQLSYGQAIMRNPIGPTL